MSKRQPSITQTLKMFFGIFMVLVYLGMAVLLAIDFFGLPKYLNWLFAVVFAAYGIFRGYREIKGEHSYGMRRYDDTDESEQYMTYAERLKQMETNDDKKN